METVTVVIPPHNRRQLLELAVRSILWQRNVEFEVIVIDDGSTDDTLRMLRPARSPGRLHRGMRLLHRPAPPDRWAFT